MLLSSNVEVDSLDAFAKPSSSLSFVREIATWSAVVWREKVAVVIARPHLQHLLLVLVPGGLRAGLPDDSKSPTILLNVPPASTLLRVWLQARRQRESARYGVLHFSNTDI